MLFDAIKSLLGASRPGTPNAGPTSADDEGEAARPVDQVHLAACVLLLDVAYADGTFTDDERAHLEAMMGRHASIDQSGPPSDGNLDARTWERAALAEEEARTRLVVDDLGFQVAELQAQLDKQNEAHERMMVSAAGSLEGSLAALRHLQSELVRTIDDGIRAVSPDPRR